MADKAPTPGELESQASSSVQGQINLEVAPYESQINAAQGGQATALAGLEHMFGNILPYAQAATKFVSDYYDKGIAQEKGIFEQAMGRLSAIRAERAADAQHMAQKIGGPVNVEAFLAPLNTSMAELPNAAATTLLHSNALSQGGVQEMAAFAGRVFPLMQVEQAAQIRNQYAAQIQQLNEQITAIRASAAERTQTRLDQLTQQERDYQLQVANQQLDRLKADRDWKLAQADLAQRKQQLATDRANLLGYYEKPYRYTDKAGKVHTGVTRTPTLSARQTATDTELKAAQHAEDVRSHLATEALDQQTIDARKIDAQKAAAHNAAAIAQQQRENASKYIDAMLNPGTHKVTATAYDRIPTKDLKSATNPNGVPKAGLIPRQMPDGSVAWFKPRSVTSQVQDSERTTNPTELYQFLVAHAIPENVAADMVRKRLALPPKWKPGDRYDPQTLSQTQIAQMDFNELRAAARKRGWKSPADHSATGNRLRNWLYDFYGYKNDVPGAKGSPVAGPPSPPKKTGVKLHTYGGKPVPDSVVWDPQHRYWYDTNTLKVWLKGHPPDRTGNPSK